MRKSISNIFTIIAVVITQFGCLDNRVAPPLNIQFENSTELLVYLESHGDYINTNAEDDFISASDVYANISTCLIIDVRDSNDFVSGHIKDAINVSPANLLQFVKNQSLSNYSKIIIVSAAGQSSAYCTALLRLAGIQNVYSMEYGMAVWHHDFASIWLNAIRDFRNSPPENYFTNQDYFKPELTTLPQIENQNVGASVHSKLESRINMLLAAGFNEKLTSSSAIQGLEGRLSDESEPAIIPEIFYENYYAPTNSFPNYFIMCYGISDLYSADRYTGPFANQGHIPGAIRYIPRVDLRSTENLQTIPPHKPVIMYDINGHVSAKVAAYLRVLGYNAKSILFGANNLFYSRVVWKPTLYPFAFLPERILDLPYYTGN